MMSRRIWIALLFVVGVLALTPYLPYAWGTLQHADYAAMGRNIVAGLQLALAFVVSHPEPFAGGAAGLFAVLLLMMALRWRADRKSTFVSFQLSRPVHPRTIRAAIEPEPIRAASVSRTVFPSEVVAVAPVPVARAVAAPTSAAPPVLVTESVMRKVAPVGRGKAVRRLFAEGHSSAEISRATRVGQDAVRLVLHRQGASA